jgi:hypothetical protein
MTTLFALAFLLSTKTFEIPFTPFTTRVPVEGREVKLDISGKAFGEDKGNALAVHADITASLADLRAQIAPILRAKVNRDDDCNEKREIRSADLIALPPVAQLSATAHYEKWVCAVGIKSRLAQQNGDIRADLIPAVEGDSIVIRIENVHVDADGVLGQLLKDDIFGPWLLNQLRALFPRTLTVGNIRDALPAALKDVPASLSNPAVIDIGNNTPAIRATLEMTIPAEKMGAILAALNKTP